jgi:fermentation-respiration switch protein FrsA (DUF1100 family)
VRLLTIDGVAIDAYHDPGPGDRAFVVAHGFTGAWRKPAVRRAAAVFAQHGGVVSFDFRGHGQSAGGSTLGDLEIYDLDAAVQWARELGYRSIATVGFSMGSSVVVRHAALLGGVDAVAGISGPARWYYRGTPAMRRVHLAIEHPVGRAVSRVVLGTRIAGGMWDPVPPAPYEVAGKISPTPLLVVHGDADAYFPVEHAHQLLEAAQEPKELWIEEGFGHAENAAPQELLDRVARWLVEHI